MGRNKKLKAERRGMGVSKKLSEGSRGERLRRRAEERISKKAEKRRRLGKKPLRVDRSGSHESRAKKNASKRRLELARLERLVSKQEELLRDYRPPVQETPLDPELKRKRRRRDFYDLDTSHWKLTGAARPADSLPGVGGKELENERDDWKAGEDLFEKLGGAADSSKDGGDTEGRFYEGPEACREYLDLNHRLARALSDDVNESSAKGALKRYRRCLELDPADHVMARRGLVRLLLDRGDADEARAIIDRFPDDRGCEMAWSLVAIEFIAWSILDEGDAGEQVAAAALGVACQANPFLAWSIAHREIFDEVVEHADEIVDPPSGSVEEAFWYMSREGGLWASLDGSSEWVSEYLLRNETLPPDPHRSSAEPRAGDETEGDGDGSTIQASKGSVERPRGDVDRDSTGSVADTGARNKGGGDHAGMFANMFETAVGMAAEMVAQSLGGVDGEDGEQDGGREDVGDEALSSREKEAGADDDDEDDDGDNDDYDDHDGES